MKTLLHKIGLLVLLGSYFLNSQTDYQKELLTLSRIDLLPQYRDNSIVKQISSYDTTGGNDDGFSGTYSFLRKENNNLVIADLKGSGIIQRIWTPTPTQDTIQFFFDNESDPRISLPFIDLFSGKEFPFLRPVVGNEVGGYYCYVPIPYKTSCKILFKGSRMQFFQIQYRENKPGVSISSYPLQFSQNEKDALNLALKTWSSFGKEVLDLLSIEGIKSQISSVILKPGEKSPIFDHQSSGRILGFELIPQAELNTSFKDLFLLAKWDDDLVPAINCPVGDFFGYAYGIPSMQSMLSGVKNGVHYCFFPMPYDKKASMELHYLMTDNNRNKEIPCTIKVYYSESGRKNDEGKFYSQWKREINPEMNKPYTILEKNGRGHHVGTMLQSQGLNAGMTVFFEGDDICTIDGEVRLHGTGSEDYFNGGWYALADRWEQAFSLPVHGCLAYSIPLARTGGYRLCIPDKVSFEQNFQLTIEHGPVNNNVPVDYTSVAYYYCDRPPQLNSMPPKVLLEAIQAPSLMEYYLQLLTVKALSNGASLSRVNMADAQSGQNYGIMKLEAGPRGYIKFELEVPGEGEYKLYLSYFKGPDCSSFTVNQRQIPVSGTIDAFATENTAVNKEYIGSLFIKEGTNTITVMLKENPAGAEKGSFYLTKIYLEKI